jgi:hypothetical protein
MGYFGKESKIIFANGLVGKTNGTIFLELYCYRLPENQKTKAGSWLEESRNYKI